MPCSAMNISFKEMGVVAGSVDGREGGRAAKRKAVRPLKGHLRSLPLSSFSSPSHSLL